MGRPKLVIRDRTEPVSVVKSKSKSKPIKSKSKSKSKGKVNQQKIKDPVVKSKKKVGRPSKKPQFLAKMNHLAILYSAGLTDKEVVDIFDITEKTLANWKKQDPQFFQSIKNWKEAPDTRVERSLFMRACGGRFGGKDYPPDPVSCIFWLKNRRPQQWRDKQEIKHEGGDVPIRVVTITKDDK